MLSFNDPEDELVFALFLPCGTVIVALLAAIAVPLVTCVWICRALKRATRAIGAGTSQLVALGVPEARGDRVVF